MDEAAIRAELTKRIKEKEEALFQEKQAKTNEELRRRIAEKEGAPAEKGVLGKVADAVLGAGDAYFNFAMPSALGAADALSAGFYDNGLAAILSPFTGGGYEGALKNVRDFQDEHTSSIPAKAGYFAGGLASVPLAARMAAGVLPAAAAGQGMKALASAGYNGLMGALSGVGTSNADTLEDAAAPAVVGGLLGAAAGPAVDAAIGVAKGVKNAVWPSADVARKNLATQLFDNTATRTGGDTSVNNLLDRAKELGPDAIGADLHPALRSQVAGGVGAGASDEAVGELYSAVNKRDLPGIADDEFSAVFGDPMSRTNNAYERKLSRENAADWYEHVLANNDHPRVSGGKLRSAITSAFDSRVTPVGTRKDVQQRVQKLIDGKLGDRGAITLRDGVDLQHELDATIADYAAKPTPMDGGKAVNATVYRELVAARSKLNAYLKTVDPEFELVSSRYAGEAELDGATKMAAAVFSNPNKQMAADTAAYYNGLSDAGKEQFKATAVYELARKRASGDSVAWADKAAGKRGGDAVADAIRTVFGKDTADRLIKHADKLGTFGATNDTMRQAFSSLEKSSVAAEGDASMAKSAIDLLATGYAGAKNGVLSAAASTSARRGVTDFGGRLSDLTNTERVKLGAMSGEDLAAALNDLYLLSRKPDIYKPSAPGSFVGMMAGNALQH